MERRIDIDQPEHAKSMVASNPPAATEKRRLRRIKAVQKIIWRQASNLKSEASALGSPLQSAALLAAVGIVLFSPLLLDDIVFRASYLMRPSEDQVVIEQPTVLAERPGLLLSSGIVSVPPSLSGKPRTGEALAALVKGGAARIALKNPVFKLDLSGQGLAVSEADNAINSGERVTAAMAPLIAALQNAAFETLVIRDGTVVLAFGGGRTEELASLDIDVAIKRRTATHLKGTAMYRGELLRLDIVVGPRLERRGAARFAVSGRIESGLFQVVLDGRLDVDGGVALHATSAQITMSNVRSVARWLGHVWSSGAGLRDFSARGTLDWTGSTLAMNKGTFHLDGNEASGALSLTLGDRAQVAGTVAFGRMDLTPYFPRSASASASASASVYAGSGSSEMPSPLAQVVSTAPASPTHITPGISGLGPAVTIGTGASRDIPPRSTSPAALAPSAAAPASPEMSFKAPVFQAPVFQAPVVQALKQASDLRWPMVGLIDLDLRLSAEQVRLGTFEAGRAAASVSSRNGQLLFNIAELLLPDGGTVVGELNLSGPAAYPNYAVRGRLEDVELATVSNVLIGFPAIKGLGQFDFDVTSSGTSGLDVLSRLDGKIEAQLPGGGTLACSHKSIATAARTSRISDICASSTRIGPTTLKARLAKGSVVAEGVEAIEGDDLIRLNGAVNLVSHGIDLALTSGPVPPAIVTPVAPPSAGQVPASAAAGPAAGPGQTGAGSQTSASTASDPKRVDRSVILVRGRADALNLTVAP